jgi:hypothetical protein
MFSECTFGHVPFLLELGPEIVMNSAIHHPVKSCLSHQLRVSLSLLALDRASSRALSTCPHDCKLAMTSITRRLRESGMLSESSMTSIMLSYVS